MLGKASLVVIGVAAAAGAVLFETSFEVQELEGTLASVNRKIVSEHDQIQVLTAEWNLLNVPGRLESLAARHLKLQPAGAKQYGSLEAIPDRPTGVAVARASTPYDTTVVATTTAGVPLPAVKPTVAAIAKPAADPAKRPAPTSVAALPASFTAPRAAGPAVARNDDGVGVLIARLGATR